MTISKDNLFGLVILMSAISGIRSILPLGEIQYEGYVLPLLLFLGLSIVTDTGKWKVGMFTFFCIVLLFLLSSFFLNLQEILQNSFKGKSGLGKFFNQSILTVILVFFSIYSAKNYDGRVKDLIDDMKKYSIYSFYLVVFYCILEYLAFFIQPFDSIVNGIDLIIRDPMFVEFSNYYQRLRGLQYETPAFGGYLGFMCIIFLDKIVLDRKPKYIVHYIIVLILGILSGSRTALVLSILISFFFMVLISKSRIIKKRYVYISIFASMLLFASNTAVQGKLLSVVSGFDEKSEHAFSNLVRFGSQIAAVNMALDNPFTGIGYSQFGFIVKEYYPEWAKLSPVTQGYMSQYKDGWPNGYSLFTRLFAELGIIFFIVFIVSGIRIFLILYKQIGKGNKENHFYLFAVLLYVHSVLTFLQFDSIRNIYFWCFVSLTFLIVKKNKRKSLT